MNRYLLILIALPLCSFAAIKPIKAPPLNAQQFAAAQAQTQESHPIKSNTPSKIMVITPEARGKDFQQAYNFLRKANATAPISVTLKNGTILNGIMGIELMTEGTIVIFKFNTTRGAKYRVENIENIISLN